MVPLSKEHVLPGLIAVVTVAFLISLWPSFSDASGPVIQVGDDAPDFSLMSDTGQAIQLKDFRGKFVVLNFWATWCPPCIEELPSLERFHNRFAGQDVVVLGVSIDEDANVYRQFLQKEGIRFLTVRDPADGTKLWTTQQWSNDATRCVWKTRIIEYQIANPGQRTGRH